MQLYVTGLYAGLLALIGFVLAFLVGSKRGKLKISLGDGGNVGMIEANRRHMNWLEYVPIALILMAIIEINGGSSNWLHVLGGTLTAARIIHPFGITMAKMMHPARFVGATLTMLVTAASIVTVLWQHFR
jgi:uncharacterized membrane protein YecN with MAPEG domain